LGQKAMLLFVVVLFEIQKGPQVSGFFFEGQPNVIGITFVVNLNWKWDI
jgi:hypothetical protein